MTKWQNVRFVAKTKWEPAIWVIEVQKWQEELWHIKKQMCKKLLCLKEQPQQKNMYAQNAWKAVKWKGANNLF